MLRLPQDYSRGKLIDDGLNFTNGQLHDTAKISRLAKKLIIYSVVHNLSHYRSSRLLQRANGWRLAVIVVKKRSWMNDQDSAVRRKLSVCLSHWKIWKVDRYSHVGRLTAHFFPFCWIERYGANVSIDNMNTDSAMNLDLNPGLSMVFTCSAQSKLIVTKFQRWATPLQLRLRPTEIKVCSPLWVNPFYCLYYVREYVRF